MAKFNITKGKVKTPIRLVAYGAEGIGKSTFASQFPDPLFIDVEGGTKQLDVARFPEPESWAMLLDEIDAVIDEPEICQTLVIDTIDRAEQLLLTALLREGGVDSIEKYGGGYGKGYTALQERFLKDFLNRLDIVIAKGVNVTLLAHAMMRKLETPDSQPYDRWELKVSKKVAPIVKEWSDILLFMHYDVIVVEENGKAKARGQARRRMEANHRPVWDAKNRYGLGDDLDLSFEPLRAIYEGTVPVRKEANTLQIDAPEAPIYEDPEPEEDIRDVLVRRLKEKKISKKRFEEWLIASARIQEGGHASDLSATMAQSMVDNIDTLAKVIGGKK